MLAYSPQQRDEHFTTQSDTLEDIYPEIRASLICLLSKAIELIHFDSAILNLKPNLGR